ncbi:hypothetical protein ILUMI_00846 [Ignelater luminosus]|uniref:Uncharacterized protein n=1 Tax=Ignelater luminosus TaxID=2038154 RepID=A0A8K0DFH3_IGNLU|nr:hypothetical protein ILUMI_00846 [Ignelater luminosus]
MCNQSASTLGVNSTFKYHFAKEAHKHLEETSVLSGKTLGTAVKETSARQTDYQDKKKCLICTACIAIVQLHIGTVMIVSKRELYEILKNDDTESQSSSSNSENILIQYLQTKFKLHHFNQRWKTCHRNKNVFLKKYDHWSNTTITINNLNSVSSIASGNDKKVSRPQKTFSSSGPKTKRRKMQSLLTERSLSHKEFREIRFQRAHSTIISGYPRNAIRRKVLQKGHLFNWVIKSAGYDDIHLFPPPRELMVQILLFAENQAKKINVTIDTSDTKILNEAMGNLIERLLEIKSQVKIERKLGKKQDMQETIRTRAKKKEKEVKENFGNKMEERSKGNRILLQKTLKTLRTDKHGGIKWIEDEEGQLLTTDRQIEGAFYGYSQWSRRRGVRQGGVLLSPLRFTALIDEISKECKPELKGARNGVYKLQRIEFSEKIYTDDLVIG